MALKDSWKDAGTGFGHAFRDLGKAFAHTAKQTIHKVDEWANGEEEEKEQPVVVERPEPVIVEEDK